MPSFASFLAASGIVKSITGRLSFGLIVCAPFRIKVYTAVLTASAICFIIGVCKNVMIGYYFFVSDVVSCAAKAMILRVFPKVKRCSLKCNCFYFETHN